jgi:hypothetical protein
MLFHVYSTVFPNSMSMITVTHLYSISPSLQCSNTVTDMFLHAYSVPNSMLCHYAHTVTRIPTFIGGGFRFILSIALSSFLLGSLLRFDNTAFIVLS